MNDELDTALLCGGRYKDIQGRGGGGGGVCHSMN